VLKLPRELLPEERLGVLKVPLLREEDPKLLEPLSLLLERLGVKVRLGVLFSVEKLLRSRFIEKPR
jgi:hypothetical protein